MNANGSQKEQNRFSPPIVGATSLFIVFAILCLTVFTLLTLSTANADRKLSDRSAEATESYYSADLEAETILAKLRNGIVPESVTVVGNNYTYTCTISSTQFLCVEVENRDGAWIILRWQAVSENM